MVFFLEKNIKSRSDHDYMKIKISLKPQSFKRTRVNASLYTIKISIEY